MKRGIFIFFILILVFTIILSLTLVSATDIFSIIGRIIWGKATSSSYELSITVTVPAPALSIVRPLNYTYMKTENIPLNFTSDGNSFWYNLNHTNNNTITGNTTFSAPVGEHILFLYANNTLNLDAGFTTENVVFSVNPSRIDIRYAEFNDSVKGDSTDYYAEFCYEELGNISNLVLENTAYGKILFNEIINLTNDEDIDDNLIDLDSNINISFNRIEINSTALPNFNKQATLSLYNLTFTNPRVLKDNEVCSSSECTEVSYDSGTGIFIFNVTGFTIYSAEETPSNVTMPPSAEEPAGEGGWSGKVTEEETKVPQIRIPSAVSPLFDVIVTIPEKYKILMPGEKLIAQVNIINVKAPEGVDILINHYIRNSSDTDIFHEFETRRIERKISFIKEIKLFEDLEPGDYLFYITVPYENTTAIGGAFFKVLKEKTTEKEKLFVAVIVVGIILVFAIALAIYYYERQRKAMKLMVRRLDMADLYKTGLIKSRKKIRLKNNK